MILNCTFLANCGLLLANDNASILVDAPNGQHTQFDGTTEDVFDRMLRFQTPYNGLCGAFFTHAHADHCDRKRLRELAQSRTDMFVFVPNGMSAEHDSMRAGDFLVRSFAIPHSGKEFSDVAHRVLLVEECGHRIYITGDADWTSPVHQEILDTYKPDAGVWNPNFVSHEEGRTLLSQLPRNFIYHMPVRSADVFGIARKCRTSFVRFKDELRNTCLIDDYPVVKEI